MRAPAKLNLSLFLGPERGDGLHEICSLFCPVSLSDRIEVQVAETDEVVCEGIDGNNLAATALEALRDRGWAAPPVRLRIEKRIPVAAGLGGGSADAAAVLRLAEGEVEGLAEIAAGIGADVPSQLDPGLALVRGGGERVERLPDPRPFGVVLVPFAEGLETGSVYAEADRLGLGRPREELDEMEGRLRAAARDGFDPLAERELLVNDLESAALSLRPEIGGALAAIREAGAAHVMVTGSGPTAVGICRDIAEADRVAASLPALYSHAIVAVPERRP